MATDINELKIIIRSLLIPYKDPPQISILRRDFRESEGVDIPFSKFGFGNILDFLHSLKDTVIVRITLYALKLTLYFLYIC